MRKKMLWVGDAGCPSGFARATHEILAVAREEFDVTVLGLNYRGDPLKNTDNTDMYPYPIYAAAAGGDSLGVGRLFWMCDLVKPDVIVFQNDGWHIPYYMSRLKAKRPNGEFVIPEYASVPVVAIVAVDGKNFRGEWLNGVTHAIFWTQFALDEARLGGYKGTASVIPLGVDTTVFHPMDKYDARFRRSLPKDLDDAFIVGNVNRNQPRKRWDLTIAYFAEWIHSKKPNAYLFLHTAPTGDEGPEVQQLVRYYAAYYGIALNTILMTPPDFYGISDQEMCETYNCFDVQISTTQGEGFGLTTFEGMACGIPQILPDWSALGELTKDGAWLVPCTSMAINPVTPGLNVIGGVPDQKKFVSALHALYTQESARKQNGQAALEVAQRPRYRWANVGRAYTDAIVNAMVPREEAVA